MAWRPGRGAQKRALEAAYEDVPSHLRQPLWNWIDGCFQTSWEDRSHRVHQLGIHLRVPLPPDPYPARQQFLQLCNDSTEFMLDLIEAELELYGWDDGRAKILNDLLRDGNSAYRVREDRRGLELLVTPEVKAEVQAVVNAAQGSAGDHLRTAWDEAYGRHADPVKAYAESIKAVEAAMAPVISPQNLKATLGTMIKDVMNKPTKWKFVIADGRAVGVDTVLAMMQMLWDGQTSRHGGVNPTRKETVEEARAAVHIAATLVQFAVGKSFTLA